MTHRPRPQAERTLEGVRAFKWIALLSSAFLALYGFTPGAWAFGIAGVVLWGLERAR